MNKTAEQNIETIIDNELRITNKSGTQKLLAVLKKSPPPPCVDCGMFDYCTKTLSACPDYKDYVEFNVLKKENRSPTHATYWRIYVKPKLTEV